MKHLKNLLLIASALLIGACSDDETSAEQGEKATGIELSVETVDLDPGAAATVRITAIPAGAKLDPSSIRLVDATGAAPAHVTVQSVEKVAAGELDLILRDNKASSKYTDALQVTSGKLSAALTVRSTPYMPVVYVTTQVSQGSITKDTWVPGTIRIDGGNRFDDLDEMATQVKGRGNSTWGWEKKPYALKLDKKQPVLGMPKHKRWCLIANYMDRTHMRNRVAYHIGANSNLDYTPRNEYAELYFNGKYQGLYLLTEQIKVDENRVNIPEMDASDNSGDALTGGYLLEFDTNYDEDMKFRSTGTYIPVNIKSPDPEEMTSQQFSYIQSYVNQIDAAMAAYWKGQSGADPFQWLDRESMIDFWICFEVMANHEILHPKSIYFHKDRGGKLVAGPIWDFDYETLVTHTQSRWINYEGFLGYEFNWHSNGWWVLLLKNDASFRADLKRRWQEWYPFLKTIPEFMEQERKAIAAAEKRNLQVWPRINGTGNPNGDESLSFDAAVDRLKSVYSARLEWMNSQIGNW